MDILKSKQMQTLALNMKTEFLAEIPGIQRGAREREFFRFPHAELPCLPRGAIIEISGAPGAGKTELVLTLLAGNPQTRVAWVEEIFTVYPCAFPQSGVDLDRVLFVRQDPACEEPLWAAHQILKSQVFGLAVLSMASRKLEDVVTLRRLQ